MRFNKILGIEAILQNGTVRYNGVILRRQRGRIEVLHRFQDVTDLAEALTEGGKDLPVALTVSGQGIMHRAVPREASDPELLRALMPGAKVTEFYIQRFHLQAEDLLQLSVIRKTVADALLAQLNALSLKVVSLYLGPYQLLRYKNLIKGLDWTNLAAHADLSQVKIGEEELRGSLALSYIGALGPISGDFSGGLALESLIHTKEEVHQRRLFKWSLQGILALTFIVLLLNVFYFMKYSDELAEIPLSSTKDIEAELSMLSNHVAQEQELLHVLASPAIYERFPRSIMADRIGASLPAEVILSEMAMGLKNEAETRQQRKPVYEATAMRISGQSTDLESLQQWIKGLGFQSFIRQVHLDNYQYNDKESIGEFSLTLELNEP